jgi:VanZ family protein
MRKILFFVPAILYYGLIFLLSSRSFDSQVDILFLDKGVHFLEFTLLGFLLASGYFLSLKSSIATKSYLTMISGMLLGGLDELHQYFVPTRSLEAMDFVADSIGVLAGLLIYFFLSRTGMGKLLTEKLLKIGR